MQENGGLSLANAVALDAGGEIKVTHAVPRQNDAVLPLQEGLAGFDAPRGAKGRFLRKIGDGHPPGAAVTEVICDLFRQITQSHGDLGDAVAAEQQNEVLQYRTAEEGDHGLGQIGGEGAQPCTLAACQ